MLSTFAGMVMAFKVHVNQMKYPIMKKRDSGVAECIYRNEIEKVDEIEKYEKSNMPESGYMTREEYELKSRAKSKKELQEEVKNPNLPKDSNMVYVPQKTFKLVKYNDPIGSPELTLPRKLNFDRQINAQGIISGDKTIMVYPAVYYYAQTDCTSCDLFMIKLDPSLKDTEKVMKANIVQKEENPLLSTSKDIDEKYIFRTLTPIDFSSDNKRLVIKEKTGHRHDGIWKTELWVYDFETKESHCLPQIRDAIIEYWAQNEGIDFDEKRWDIYPMGFDVNDDNRIIVCAYAYTGEVPKFLGTWSIDVNGVNSKLEALDGYSFPVSVIGYRLVEDSVKDITEVEFEAKLAKKLEKAEDKKVKEAEKYEKKVRKLEHQRKLQQMDMETLYKIQQRKQDLKQLQKNNSKKPKKSVTGIQ